MITGRCISTNILTQKFRELENNFKAQIRATKIEVGYALLVSDEDKKKIQKLTEKTRVKIGKEVLKKSHGDFKKAIGKIMLKIIESR